MSNQALELATFAHEEPLYNIGAVGRMTGVPLATLRIWERRYGFPKSMRTPGRHRIFSEREVERVRWVKARIDEGMQVSQAVHALEYLERRPTAPLPLPPPNAAEPSTPDREPNVALAAFQARFSDSLLRHDLESADQILGETLVVFRLEDVILSVIRPTLVEIGAGWEQGVVTVATEHLASYYLRQRLLLWLAAGPPPRLVLPVVMACAPGDWHETGLLMLAVLLGRQRWPVTYLGPSLPLADLAAFVRETRPAVVVLAATIEETALALREWPRWLPEAAETGRPAICFGGRIFSVRPELRGMVRGVFLGEGLEDGLATLDRVLRETTGEKL